MTYYHIRYGTLDDIPALQEVSLRSYTDRIAARKISKYRDLSSKTQITFSESLKYYLRPSSSTHTVLLLEEKDKQDSLPTVTGFLIGHQATKTTFHIDHFHTLFTTTRRGQRKRRRGKRLLSRLEDMMRTNGQHLISLTADIDAIIAYEHMGFVTDPTAEIDMKKDLRKSKPLVIH